VRKPGRKGRLGRTKYRLEDNIIMEPTEIALHDLGWINLAGYTSSVKV
jgi:hypothetical protein